LRCSCKAHKKRGKKIHEIKRTSIQEK
jgi:hypothetical protein